MSRRLIIYLLILSAAVQFASAQEVVRGLQNNRILNSRDDEITGKARLLLLAPVELPFFDDFSERSNYPDPEKWTDNYVFINNTLSDKQITCGIATFDALDSNGRLYDIADTYGFRADELTSQPLNLAYTADDNLWMSFFYQAGGLGDAPETNDSLTLQFYAPDESKWYSVWHAAGTADKRFRPVMIRISDSKFLKSGFQFRFANYASLSPNENDISMVGNCDQWNLDYVLIDKNRNAGDTIFNDVALTLPVRSVLKNYEAMPWKQFREVELQEMGSVIQIHYRNNDTITRNVTRNFEIYDKYANAVSYAFSSGASNVDPLSDVDYNAGLVYTFSSGNNDSALFRITSMLKTDQFDPKQNDTLIYYQVFNNYFAYDDGSAEAGYGINGLGSKSAMFAHRFTSFMPDTIRAINICFNDSYQDANKRAFDLMVWDDNNGYPGNVIYALEEVMVEQGTAINGYYTYRMHDKVPVNGDFYIGWRQRSEVFLNAGLDVNSPHNGRQFYFLNGNWQSSIVAGTVMIRPVVGNALTITGVDDIPATKPEKISIWPNPASDNITIDASEQILDGRATITIIDLQGRELQKSILTRNINISSLPPGAYIILTRQGSRTIGYSRLIKTK
jgi:hypothetical protein